MVDWDKDINQYFKMPIEEREEVISTLAKRYFELIVDNSTETSFNSSMGYLIHQLDLRHRLALKEEEYERADIFYKLIKIYMNYDYGM